jgi:YgiT-type zinc finger domain-containing protein
MIGEHASNKCPVCGGTLVTGGASIPYVLKGDIVVVIKNVPADICSDCHEAFTSGLVTDQVVHILNQLKELGSEVSVVSYVECQPV